MTREDAPWVAEQFGALSQNSTAQSGRIGRLRKLAFERFLALGIPTTGQEDWRYTNLTPIARTSFVRAPELKNSTGLLEFVSSRTLKESALSGKIVIVNGRFAPQLSIIPRRAELSVTLLGEDSSPLDDLFEKDGLYESESLVALNVALSEEILCISVAAGARVEKPLEILSLTIGESKPTSTFPRVLIQVARGAELSVVEKQISTGGETFTSTVTEFDIAENASLTHMQIQDLGADAKQVGILKGRIARDAKLFSHVFHLGGSVVRNEIRPVFTGSNAEAYLNGLTAVTGKQHIDNFTVIDHAEPHCFSRELYKGIYSESSSGVFCGTIVVQQKAQKTNAIQSNQSLLLSPTATVETKPQLKIWADDVKCTHGATVGQLDENALFYLRARGIPEKTAKKMLTEAFLGELLDSVPEGELRDHVRALFDVRLAELMK